MLYGKKDAGEKRKVKRIVVIVAVIFFSLQMLAGLLSTLSFVMYPVIEGAVPAGQVEGYKLHFDMARMATAADCTASAVLCLGAIVAMAMDLSKKTGFSWKRKVGLYLAMLGATWLIAIFWGIIHPTYGIVDFIARGPAHFVSVTVILLIDLLVSALRNRPGM